ncbi:SWR1-complex protein 4-like [Lotus japonicus]|uniref:SWR1-complex protein 4-like n=1 Tax=Lotus japonicus TaxID=34305 RepID=UPI0025868791|nr:SWR1-complex protein 4-like [Lotus japonicus]
MDKSTHDLPHSITFRKIALEMADNGVHLATPTKSSDDPVNILQEWIPVCDEELKPVIGKITWQWLPFTSSARKDNLQLYHWVRVVNGVPPTGDYFFCQSVDIIRYTDEEYDKHLTNPMWTKEETDELFDLCERFDLRFIVIADRFPSSRTVEELKDRYYSVSRAILIARAPSLGDVATRPVAEESQLAVTSNAGAEVSERAVPSDTVSPLNVPSTSPDNASILASLACRANVQAANSSTGLRTVKRIEQSLQDLGVNLKPKVPTKAVCADHLELRKEIQDMG